MTIVAMPPDQANNMRFIWLLTAFYDAKATRMARDVLSAAVHGVPVKDRAAKRLLGHLQVDPRKAIRLLEQGAGKDEPNFPGHHLLMQGFVSLADFYGLLEIAFQLNLVPWPLRQSIKNETILFLTQDRFSYFFRERYRIPLIPSLQERLHNNLRPPNEDASPQEIYAFNALLSTHSYLSADRDIRTFLYSEFTFGRDPRRTLSRTKEERCLGLGNRLDIATIQKGFWRFLSAIREMSELKSLSANSRMPPLLDSFYAPWIDFMGKNYQSIINIAQAEVQAEFQADEMEEQMRDALNTAIKRDIAEVFKHWLKPPQFPASNQRA